MQFLLITALYIFFTLFISMNVLACPLLPEIDVTEGEVINLGAKNIVIKYYEASKKGDAKTASSLIDYEEWAKDMNLEDNQKKQWIDLHKQNLQETYDTHKKEGSTKNYKILASEVKGNEATFKVSQERTSGVYIWEVKLTRKNTGTGGMQWRIKGFYQKEIEGKGGQIFNIIID